MNLEKIIFEAVKEVLSKAGSEPSSGPKAHGFEGFINQKILIFTSGYFYCGFVVGVFDDYVTLKDAHIVYETGCFSDKEYANAQKLHCDLWNISFSAIESFGLSK